MAFKNEQTRKWFDFPLPIQPRIPFVAAGLLSLMWGGFMFRDGRELLADHDAARKNPVELPQLSMPLQTVDITTATALNLFGKVDIKPALLDAATLPDSTANLQLIGLFASSRQGASRSIIAEQGKPGKSYVEGDALPGNVSLYRIENDCVIVQRGDQFEKLALPGSSLGKHAAPLHSFADIAQASIKAAAAAPPPTVSTKTADKSEGPQAIYRALDATLAALQKNKK